ncbi:chlorophyll synthase ChlG [Breoghania sp. JC706]|uniref:chlorophyll synthase ChlG n=1 Tax=Breoghania sp. JC706 TaxID=3117732 RepID=UPI00300AC740
MDLTRQPPQTSWPSAGAVIELLKPITWFPPMWAYACGVISAGPGFGERFGFGFLGVLLAGPLLCGTSQAVNDWYDRFVDAINEPNRVIPSGRMPGQWGLYIAFVMSALSLLVAWALGTFIFAAALLGLALAWGYSAPPLRFKRNGWLGNGVVGFSYETLPWLTAATAMTGYAPAAPLWTVALLYGAGAHGILTLNDFKSIAGDTEMSVKTLPVLHGARPAAIIACMVMAAAQTGVVLTLWFSNLPAYALAVLALLFLQLVCMMRFVRDPVRFAVWYSTIGVGLFVSGMMVTAFGLRSLAAITV